MRPGLLRSAAAGLPGLVRVRAAVLLWLLGVLAAAPVALAVGTSVHAFFGARPAGQTIAAGLDPLHLVSFGTNAELSGLRPAALAALLLWFLLAPVAHGVAFGAAGGARSVGALLGRAGACYARLWAVQLVGLVILGITVGPAVAAVRHLGGPALDDWTSAPAVLSARVALGLGVLAVAGLAKGAVDAARARVVVDDAGLGAALVGLGAGLRRPVVSLGLVALYAGLGLGLTVLVAYVDAGLVRDAVSAFWLGLGLQQGTALARSTLRLGLAGAQTFAFATSREAATMPPRG